MRTEQKNGFKIVGLKITTDMENVSRDCHKMWEEYMKVMDKISNKSDDKVCYNVSVMKDEKSMVCYACHEVSDFESIPEGMDKFEVPSAKYAVIDHHGSVNGLKDSWSKVMTDVPESGYKNKMASPCFERYDERFKNDDNSVAEIWVPIEE